jgi:hypothetical protein
VTVSLDVANLTELELPQEVLKLRQRVQKLAALLPLALVLLPVSRFTLADKRGLTIRSCCLTSTDSATTERAPPGRRVGRLSSAGG